MTAAYRAALVYVIAGLVAGLYFREMTRGTPFEATGQSQLSVVHTHVLVLGFLMMLLVLLLDRAFDISRSSMFRWFFWVYNAGVIVTAGMMVWHGTLTVTGHESNAMISGIAGIGHVLLTLGLLLLFAALGPAVRRVSEARRSGAGEVVRETES